MLSAYEYAIKCFVLVICQMMSEVPSHSETNYIQIHHVLFSFKSGSEVCFRIFVQ
jgi:hypothetical protein